MSHAETATVIKFLNEKHKGELVSFASKWGALAEEGKAANGWSQGSFEITSAELRGLSAQGLNMRCTVRKTGFFGKTTDSVVDDSVVPFGVAFQGLPDFKGKGRDGDDGEELVASYLGLVRRDGTLTVGEAQRAVMALARLCGRVEATASMVTLTPAAASSSSAAANNDNSNSNNNNLVLPQNLFINNVPNSLDTRYHFYDSVVDAVEQALRDPSKSSLVPRMQIKALTPELDKSMDSYRVGTLLELVREVATRLACSGRRVRVCVQGPMGRGIFVGLPLSLNGVRQIVEMMDWQSGPGEAYEGIVPNYVRFGGVGAEEVDKGCFKREGGDDPTSSVGGGGGGGGGGEGEGEEGRNSGSLMAPDDFFIVIMPQNIVGFSLIPQLEEMLKAAAGRPVLLVNPNLDDIASAEDKMSVRGRAARLAFQASFQTIYEWHTVYPAPSRYFPILGAVVKSGPRAPYVAYERQERRQGQEWPSVAPGASGDDEGDDADVEPFVPSGGGLPVWERHVPRGTFDALPSDPTVLDLLKKSGARWT